MELELAMFPVSPDRVTLSMSKGKPLGTWEEVSWDVILHTGKGSPYQAFVTLSRAAEGK